LLAAERKGEMKHHLGMTVVSQKIVAVKQGSASSLPDSA
jgi:hypothetical protein